MADLPYVLEADQDFNLVGRFKEGEMEAFDVLFCRYKDVIYSLVFRSVGQADADDVVQEVFIRVYKSLPRFLGNSSFKTWLYSVALNVCREHLRKRGRRSFHSLDESVCALPDHSDLLGEVSGILTRQELERAIGTLPYNERTAVEMHYAQGMTYQEIAQILKSPIGTIKARIHNAVSKLRRKLLFLMEEVDEQ